MAIGVVGGAAEASISLGSETDSARFKKCEVFLNEYDSHTATIQEAQKYANCVDLVFPQAAFSGSIGFKALLILFLCCAVLGFLKGVRNKKRDDLTEFMMDGFVYGSIYFFVSLMLVLFCAGVWAAFVG